MLHYGVSAHIGNRVHSYGLPVLLAAVVVCLLLEVYLAHREKRWPGLVLPGLAFLGALAGAMPYFTARFEQLPGAAGLGLLIFLVENVPALALLAVYAVCREHRRRRHRRDQRKMNIEDI